MLSRESWKGRRCTLSSRQPIQRRLQHTYRLCGEADRPDAAQPHCELCCNSSSSLTGRPLQSRSVMQGTSSVLHKRAASCPKQIGPAGPKASKVAVVSQLAFVHQPAFDLLLEAFVRLVLQMVLCLCSITTTTKGARSLAHGSWERMSCC